jgi:hypothetical protein
VLQSLLTHAAFTIPLVGSPSTSQWGVYLICVMLGGESDSGLISFRPDRGGEVKNEFLLVNNSIQLHTSPDGETRYCYLSNPSTMETSG